MKIIVSHDIDHFLWSEHFFKDLFLPKFLAKNILYLSKRQLPLKVFNLRIKSIIDNKLGNLEDLIDFDAENGIPSTFFVAFNNGLGLSYSTNQACEAIEKIVKKGFAAGLHGIEYAHKKRMKQEFEFLKENIDSNCLGIRNHYLRMNEDTLKKLDAIGYSYDSTEYGLKNPRKAGINGMIEFPVSLMDSYILTSCQNDLGEVKNQTLSILQEAENIGLEYFTINTHDCYYSKTFPEHKAWYEWLIEYVVNNYELTYFESAVRELN
ncbi:polysaccharide deacetylase family protein [Sedimentisphaera salicampi]|uniref:hypothetical protein n=1 Tax=Sedimentisphaera salicampi TaxID=1941349 RepID=UPI000B9C375C|nr:hypothetical protein [Sedimentisphaera salicampi]OXU15567.1 hypothetical protein SMSP1_00649 [Sedimentisphaera salicampi]